MSKNYEVKSALNLNNEESYMLDNREEWEVGQMFIDEADLEKAKEILAASLIEEEIDDSGQSPKVYNGIDWDELAHLVEVQLYMKKVMGRIEWIDDRMAKAKAGDYLPHESWMALVGEKKNLWSRWNQGKTVSFSIVGEEKQLWGVFFNIENHEEFLKNHLNMDASVWNTYGRDDEEDEGFDKFYVDVIDMLAQSHLEEMKEYDMPESRGKGFWNKGNQKRIENSSLENNSQDEYCPF